MERMRRSPSVMIGLAEHRTELGRTLLIALIVGGCGGISLPPPAPPPPKMCRAPGGGYVPCDFGYHGTMGL
jgi:hypothetical protein